MNENKFSKAQLFLYDSLPEIRVDIAHIKLLGISSAITLSYFIDCHNYYKKQDLLTEDGRFYQKLQNISIALNCDLQQTKRRIKRLKDKGYLDIEKKGSPAKNYYRINFNKLVKDSLKVQSSEKRNAILF